MKKIGQRPIVSAKVKVPNEKKIHLFSNVFKCMPARLSFRI